MPPKKQTMGGLLLVNERQKSLCAESEYSCSGPSQKMQAFARLIHALLNRFLEIVPRAALIFLCASRQPISTEWRVVLADCAKSSPALMVPQGTWAFVHNGLQLSSFCDENSLYRRAPKGHKYAQLQTIVHELQRGDLAPHVTSPNRDFLLPWHVTDLPDDLGCYSGVSEKIPRFWGGRSGVSRALCANHQVRFIGCSALDSHDKRCLANSTQVQGADIRDGPTRAHGNSSELLSC